MRSALVTATTIRYCRIASGVRTFRRAGVCSTHEIGGRRHHPGPGRAVRARHRYRPCHAVRPCARCSYRTARPAASTTRPAPRPGRLHRTGRLIGCLWRTRCASRRHIDQRNPTMKLRHTIADRVAGFVRDWSLPRQFAGEDPAAKRQKARCLGNSARGSKRPTRSAPASAPIARSAARSWSMPKTGTSSISKATRAARSIRAPCAPRARRHSAG